MTNRPIGPAAHGMIDYGFMTLQAVAPTLFGFAGAAPALSYGFAALTNYLLTDYEAQRRKRSWWRRLRG
jgi:hypothetical protein